MSVHRLAVRLRGRGFGTGLGGAGAGSAASSVAFENVLTNGTLVSQIGPTLTSTRATTSYTQDFEGLLKPILVNEARFHKLRRVENNLLKTEDFTDAVWTKQAGVTVTSLGSGVFRVTFNNDGEGVFHNITGQVVGARVMGSVSMMSESSSGTVTITDPGNSSTELADVTVTAAWQRFAWNSKTTTVTSGGLWIRKKAGGLASVLVRFPQHEYTTGQAITAPSEYVSKGVLSSPWHGAGVDGVRYFTVTNPWTVASNVAMEGASTPLTLTAAGLSVFGGATNIALQSENFGTTWAAIGTPTRVAANHNTSGVTLDLLGDDDGILLEGYTQTITFTGDAVKAVSLLMKAGTSIESVIRLRDATGLADRLLAGIAWSGGVPTVTMTTGTLEGTDTLVDGVYRFHFVTAAVTAASTNNLEIYPASSSALLGTRTGTVNVGGVMAQNATSVAPYIKTTTAAVTVNADSITAAHNGGTEGTLYARWIAAVAAADLGVLELHNGTDQEQVRLSYTSGRAANVLIRDGGVVQANSPTANTAAAGTTARAAARYKLNDVGLVLNAGTAVTDATATMPTTTTIGVGMLDVTVTADTVIQEVKRFSRAYSDAELVTLTTP